MSQRILVPDFSRGKEPTLESTRKRNENGKCCFHHCNNPLSATEYPYMGFKACESCGLKLKAEGDRAQQEIQTRADAYIIQALSQATQQ